MVGDGSVRAAASTLAGSDLPLGILPLGTLNYFARDLPLPLDLEGAVRLIASGRVRLVDLVAERDRYRRHGPRSVACWSACSLPRILAAATAQGPRPCLRLGEIAQYRAAVAFGIDRNKQGLHVVGRRPDLVERLGHRAERGRTVIGTMRVSEIDQQPFPRKIGAGDRFVVRIDKREWMIEGKSRFVRPHCHIG